MKNPLTILSINRKIEKLEEGIKNDRHSISLLEENINYKKKQVLRWGGMFARMLKRKKLLAKK